MKHRRPDLIFAAVIAGICCLALVLGSYVLLIDLPRRAETAFGEPSPALSYFQRIRYALTLVSQEESLTQAAKSAGETLRFSIAADEPIHAIAARLESAGLVPDAETFTVYLLYSGGDLLIKAGDFLIPDTATPLEVAAIIQDPALQEIPYIILKGWRIEEIAESLAPSGLSITPDEFLQVARIRPDGFTFSGDLPEPGNTAYPYPIEGFLLPDSYPLPRETNVFALITAVLANFDARVTPEMRAKITAQGLTFYEGIVLASIIEREAFIEDEKPVIASVFLNRIKQGMKLEADPTVQYALGYQEERGGWWSAPLWESDLQISSPFNTYQNAGLPPGPICNPDLASIKAVAEPARTPYFYFRAACDGSQKHLFAETFEDHVNNGCP